MLIILQIILALLLILFVLLQKSGEDGTANLAGGASSVVSSGANILSRITLFIGMLFMLNSLLIARSTYVAKSDIESVVKSAHDSQRIDLTGTDNDGVASRSEKTN